MSRLNFYLRVRVRNGIIPPSKYGYFTSVTLPETNSSPLKIGHPKRKLVLKPSIFRFENVSFREGTH